jgi:hypothetical protein
MSKEETIETKKMSDLIGENASRLSESDRKLVNGVLTMGNKIPVIGAMINAGKTFKAVKNAINKYNENKENKEILEKAKSGKGMKDGGEVKKYMGGGSVHKNKSNMITQRGWGASRKT